MFAVRARTSDKPKTKQEPKVRVFADSGAFSAWKLKKPIELNDYCNWIEANNDWLDQYINLDVIDPHDPEGGAAASYANLVEMRRRGLNPIPVYHGREDISWLDRMLDLGCEYVSLGAAGLRRNRLDEWHELAWSHMVDVHGKPLIKVHALGETRYSSLSKFPWQSSDSSTLLNSQKYGIVFLPGERRMTHCLDTSKYWKFDIKSLEGSDLIKFEELLYAFKLDKNSLFDRAGRDSHLARTYLACLYFKHLEERIREMSPISFRPYNDIYNRRKLANALGFTISDFDLYIVVASNISMLPSLFVGGINKILLSFFFVSKKTTPIFRSYAYDPISIMSRPPYDKYYAIFDKILRKEHESA